MRKNKLRLIFILTMALSVMGVNAEESTDTMLLQKSFATENEEVALLSENMENVLSWEISYDKREINVGDNVTATIALKNISEEDFSDGGGIQLDINYDKNLFEEITLDDINVLSDISDVKKDKRSNGTFVIYRFGSAFSVSQSSSVSLAEVTFTAKQDIVNKEDSSVLSQKVGLTNEMVTSYDGNALYLDKIGYESPEQVTIYDIKVDFNQGEFGTITGDSRAYARYNEAGLYTDHLYETSFTLPSIQANERKEGDTCGYRVSDKGWNYTDSDLFDQNKELTAQYTKTQNIWFYNVDGADSEPSLVVADYGTEVDIPRTSEGFAGWFDADTETFKGKLSELLTLPKATADAEYKAYYLENSTRTIGDTFATVTSMGGVQGETGKVLGDITFKVSLPEWGTVTSIKAYCGEEEVAIHEENGTYVIYNSHLNGDVTIHVKTKANGTVGIKEFSLSQVSANKVYEFTPEFAGKNTGYYQLEDLKFVKLSNFDNQYMAVDEQNQYGDAELLLENIHFVTGKEILAPIPGDLDNNGISEIKEVQEVFTYYTKGVTVGIDVEKTKKLLASDMNNDCRIDVVDAQLIVIEMLK